ncbi:Uncharacterised protein [Mycobacteroides abscessus subsp. abscessus]|nr:Uncharacterised protein [Mycobacteroides abscessus subsp. abscessus]
MRITSSQNFDAEKCLPIAIHAPAARTEESETLSALLWYSGSGTYMVSLCLSRTASPPIPERLASQRLWLITLALGMPVVPDVKM